MIRFFARSRRNIFRESGIWVLAFIIAFQSFFNLLPLIGIVTTPQLAQASTGTADIGALFYGDTGAAGTVRFQSLDYSDTYTAEISGPASSASQIAFVQAKAAPSRDELLVGHIKVDGRMDIMKCVTGCDVNTEMTALINKTGVAAAMTCDATAGSCWRPFDIAYQPLNGKAMVAFGLNATTGTLQYCEYDGTNWTPASCTTPSTFVLDSTNCGTGSTGALRWVRLIPYGEKNKERRSNDILAVIGDANSDIFAARWNGSAWGNCTLITATGSTINAQNFDGAWEYTTGNAMVVWGEGTTASTTPLQYKRWIRSSTTWDSSGTTMSTTNSRLGSWVNMAGAEVATKNHIAIMSQVGAVATDACGTITNCQSVPYIWDGSAMTKGTEWASGETQITQSAGVAIEALNTTVEAIYTSTIGAGADETGYETWVEGVGFSGGNTDNLNGTTIDMADDGSMSIARSHPNKNDIYILGGSFDDTLHDHRWDGSAPKAAGWGSRETLLPPLASTNAHTEGLAFDMAMRPYNPWTRNWRFYDGADTANTPTTALANENTAVNPFELDKSFRLRINYSERTGLNSIDERKKLQYTSGCTPNTAGNETACTWTDVDNSGGSGIWRYKTTGNCASCADNTVLAGVVLTGTNATCTAGNGCGTWVLSKDAAAGANMDHNLNIIQESEWIVEPHPTTPPAYSTTYYFRVYDVEQLAPMYREQDTDDCGAGSAACTYPSLTTQAAPNVALLKYRFINDDGSETTATNKQAENTAHSGQNKNENLRLRFLVRNSGGKAPSYNYRLAFSAVSGTCDTGLVGESYADVPDAGAVEFDMALTANYVDQAASTNVASRLTDPAGTFNAGKLVEETSNQASNVTLPDGSTTNQFTELEYNFIATSNATGGGQYCFILRNSTTNLNSYSVVGDLTIDAPGPSTDQVLRHGNWWNAGTEQDFFWAK